MKMEVTMLEYLREPDILFSYGQSLLDPRDGLTIFGPYDKGKADDFSVGIIGTQNGLSTCKSWLARINKPVYHSKPDIAYPFFPGFKEVFGVSINLNSIPAIFIDDSALSTVARFSDPHVRVAEVVDLYINRLTDYLNEKEKIPKLWFVIIPDYVYTYCRPKSSVPTNPIQAGISSVYERQSSTKSLFDDTVDQKIEKWKEAYWYENDFHNQLKIKLLKHKILTQIIREGTITHPNDRKLPDFKTKQLANLETAKAWNLATAIYYKIGGIPWKLKKVRDGVCYIGLTFKQDLTNANPKIACCAAQMFLDSGAGMVFRGRVGPYYNSETREYHLTKEAATEVTSKVIASYKNENNGKPPKELFIHGKTYFDDDEWSGFAEACGSDTKVIGVRIRPEKTFKLYRQYDFPVLRGTVYIRNRNNAYLWTKGFIPRIQSVLGLETPNPLSVEIVRGDANIKQVCKDVLSLTKLNYNACIYSDGTPVTLKFADKIGDILTAGPNKDLEVLPFMYYI